MTKVAVIQHPSSFFNKEKGIQQTIELCEEAANNGCRLALFPESFIPGYPRGFSFGTVVGNRTSEGMALYTRYAEESISIENGDLSEIGQISKELNLIIGLGITERSFTGTMYCSLVYITPEEGIVGVHRKLKPTGSERIIWGEGRPEDLLVIDTDFGSIGGLICWENYMPLARMVMYKKGVQIYLAPTADARPTWINTMSHIAREGRCFVLGCNQFFTKDHLSPEFLPLVRDFPHEMSAGGSVIISPFGQLLEGPLWSKSGILYADLDSREITKAKMEFDAVGHYHRPDLLQYLQKLQQ